MPSGKLKIGVSDDMATTTLSMSPKSPMRSGTTDLHCNCSASPNNHEAMEVESVEPKLSSPGAHLQIQMEEKYLLEKIPSPIRVKPLNSGNETSSPELSPPPSPKRKREVEFIKDLEDVAFTAVLPAKNIDLHRSQSTF
ncbi:uncharacterized protein [Physcomitrium patens]|nr:uncharacterized protein LOC112281237 isoform X1 [Physcomitrium patens]|eukprot:XP_024373286.1 uncharacterized protein LOC112281237 isoform X1 [Physcomitrella patens]